MTDRQFEFAARDLLLRDGCASARQVGRQCDQAADVIAHHPVHGRIVVQCKHTKVAGKVGAQVMYQVKGTAGPVHHADVAVVVTNGGLTPRRRHLGRHARHPLDRPRPAAPLGRGRRRVRRSVGLQFSCQARRREACSTRKEKGGGSEWIARGWGYP
ncbi:restriction endonuclease [Kitasatospora sp. NPDC085879]|uniref:restriction endonuclease n=1 Tax=Kitasatospora sp. NPDC085879 TaxID=3154769 RepID=UPI00343B7119